MPHSLVTNYVDAAIEQLRRRDLMRFPGQLPEVMRDESIARLGDWMGWKAIPSTVTDAKLNELERETGLAFPPLYRDFLQYRHFVDLTEIGVRFAQHWPDRWGKELRALYRTFDPDRILRVGLLPLGSETLMDAGVVCFDTRHRKPDGDCSVVYWDHEWIGSEKEIGVMFSSSAKLFECLTMVANTDTFFLRHDASDDSASVARKQKLLAQFLALDPQGAGGPGRHYWTCWGVTPAD